MAVLLVPDAYIEHTLCRSDPRSVCLFHKANESRPDSQWCPLNSTANQLPDGNTMRDEIYKRFVQLRTVMRFVIRSTWYDTTVGMPPSRTISIIEEAFSRVGMGYSLL